MAGQDLTAPLAVVVHPGAIWFQGTAADLIADDLILPAWIPPRPKRRSSSFSFEGWWWAGAPDTFGSWSSAADWTAGHIRAWELMRRKGELLELKLWPLFFREHRGGREVPEAALLAAQHHRRMVRARSDSAFRRFLQAAQNGADV